MHCCCSTHMHLFTNDEAGFASQCYAVHRSIRKFTDEYKEKKYPIHVLLNNAAIQSPKGKRGAKTEDGFEVCPATLLHPGGNTVLCNTYISIHASPVRVIDRSLPLSLPDLRHWSYCKCLSCNMLKPLSGSLRPVLHDVAVCNSIQSGLIQIAHKAVWLDANVQQALTCVYMHHARTRLSQACLVCPCVNRDDAAADYPWCESLWVGVSHSAPVGGCQGNSQEGPHCQDSLGHLPGVPAGQPPNHWGHHPEAWHRLP